MSFVAVMSFQPWLSVFLSYLSVRFYIHIQFCTRNISQNSIRRPEDGMKILMYVHITVYLHILSNLADPAVQHLVPYVASCTQCDSETAGRIAAMR